MLLNVDNMKFPFYDVGSTKKGNHGAGEGVRHYGHIFGCDRSVHCFFGNQCVQRRLLYGKLAFQQHLCPGQSNEKVGEGAALAASFQPGND